MKRLLGVLGLAGLMWCANGDQQPASVRGISPGVSWQWQLEGDLDLSVEAEVFDVDLFDTPAEAMEALHGKDRYVICYFSAGSYEEWRKDVAALPEKALGKPLAGWEGERWLDTRHPEVRKLMQARLQYAKDRGCDGVEPDNVDAFKNPSGFALDAQTQLDFNRFLAAQAHRLGMSVGLKNDVEQVAELVNDFDWTLNEECLRFNECERLQPFVDRGKAVLHVEYGDDATAAEVCPNPARRAFSTLIKRLSLDAWRVVCPPS